MSNTVRGNKDYKNGHVNGYGDCKRLKKNGYQSRTPGVQVNEIFIVTPSGVRVKCLKKTIPTKVSEI